MVRPIPLPLLFLELAYTPVQLLLRYGIAGILVMYLRDVWRAVCLNHSFKNWMVGQK